MKKKKEKIEKKTNEVKQKNKTNKIKSFMNFNIIAIISIIIIAAVITPKTLQNDTFYTIKVGEAITTYGIDNQEHFAWHQGLKYTYPHWLYDLATYKIYSNFGLDGIYVTTMILSCILGITLYVTNSKLSKNKLISFLLTLVEIVMLSPYIAARAQLVSFILFVLTNYCIEKFLETKKKRYAISLIIIPIIIANVHAAVFPFYFVFYIPVIVEYLIAVLRDSCFIEKMIVKSTKNDLKSLEKKKDKYIKNGKEEEYEKKYIELEKCVKVSEEKFSKIKDKVIESEKNPYKFRLKKNNNVKWLILIMIIALFTGLLTPLGDTPYTYLYHTMKGNTTQYISEHLPMTLSEEPVALVLIGIILGLLLLFKTKINLRDGFMIAGMCLLMLFTRRQLSMFVIVSIIVIAKLLSELLEENDKEFTNSAIKIIETFSGNVLVLCVIISIALMIYKPKKNDQYIDSSTYPVEAVKYIKENLLGNDNFRLFNGYDYGSYLLFNDIPVFIDSRADVYDPQFNGLSQDIFLDTMNINMINVYYENKFEEYNITHVLSYRNNKLTMLLLKDKNYKVIYFDDDFVLFERKNANKTNNIDENNNVKNNQENNNIETNK